MCRYRHWTQIEHVFDAQDESTLTLVTKKKERDVTVQVIQDEITDDKLRNTVIDCIENMKSYEREWQGFEKESQEQYDEILKTLVGEFKFKKYLP